MFKLREITGLSEAEVARALHDTHGVVERALDILMEVGQVRASRSLHALLYVVHTGCMLYTHSLFTVCALMHTSLCYTL